MEKFALNLSPQLRPGDVILLNGPLGAGKTFLAQQIAKALGVTEPVTSPTFVMLKRYKGTLPINHVDAYRLLDLPNARQAFDDLDIDSEDSVTIIEWGEQFDINGEALKIDIEIGELESRKLTITGEDSRWGAVSL